MKARYNRRGHMENVVFNQHIKLKDLKEKARHLENQYIRKENIPPHPQPEFHVSHVRHDTDKAGLRGIKRDRGFKNPFERSLLWWSLVVGPDEIRSAERRLLETTYPDRTEEQAQRQQSFLEEFATSPAFNKTSRLGSYRFTFPLKELLTAYSEQFCQGAPPVMRVLRTVLYKLEVMYVVVVNSPANQKEFSDCPLLTDDDPNAVCTYKDSRFIWRAEAMCETHSYKLVQRPEEKQMGAQPVGYNPQFYVWDHVAVALHVKNKVLNFDPIRLRENLKFCRAEKPGLIRGVRFEDFSQAEENVKGLWPDDPAPLEKDE
ncbi:uncharacterized protein LOC119476189 [Sebastes umbrosus]|uniref:uncharacterized protein LOC119476189 n=1 Tax=Sebastes umbrosus TaxID=72105 RepID=UPI00189EFA9D|nr:uncharacterized protein LOC119476189 [Sebastes umbrosus]XP_037605356.1 uncharacterized protein LOC119476189 [Sebastes umbrosus]